MNVRTLDPPTFLAGFDLTILDYRCRAGPKAVRRRVGILERNRVAIPPRRTEREREREGDLRQPRRSSRILITLASRAYYSADRKQGKVDIFSGGYEMRSRTRISEPARY